MTDETLFWRDGELWKREAGGWWRELPPLEPLPPRSEKTEIWDLCVHGIPPDPVDLSDLF